MDELPSVRFEVRDRSSGTVFVLFAYREPTEEEALFAVRAYLQQKRRKKLPKNKVIEIYTLIGLHD